MCFIDTSTCTALRCALHPPMKAYCTETFGSTKLAPVVAQGQSVAELREGCDQILNIMRLNFYLLDYAVTADLDRRILIVSGQRIVGRVRRFGVSSVSSVALSKRTHFSISTLRVHFPGVDRTHMPLLGKYGIPTHAPPPPPTKEQQRHLAAKDKEERG